MPVALPPGRLKLATKPALIVLESPHSQDRHSGLHCSSILSIGQRGGRCSERCPPGLSSGRSSQPDKGINPRTHISVGDRSSGGEPQVTEQNDVTKLYEEFEEAFVDVLSAKSDGGSLSRTITLGRARSPLGAHKDSTPRESDGAVLSGDARGWKILGEKGQLARGGQTRWRGGLGPVSSLLLKPASASRSSGEWG